MNNYFPCYFLGKNGCEKRTSPQTSDGQKTQEATDDEAEAEDFGSVLEKRRVAWQGGGGDIRQSINDAINQCDFSEPEDNEDEDWIHTD